MTLESVKLTVSELSNEIKIRDYLKRYVGLSTSLIAKVKFDNVILNGEPVHMRAIVKNGDTITINLPEEDSENIEPINIPIEILYEDEYIIAVNKPMNMPVHPCRGNSLPTLANAIRYYIGSPFVFRAVNRLDRDTSGIVIIAKNQLSAAKLCTTMKNKHFDKKYIAIVEGKIKSDSGVINAPIVREHEGSIKRIVRPDGKESITEYRLLGLTDDGNSIVELKPLTGRTHQIRVHMSYIGHPLVNDFLYGNRVEGKSYYLQCNSITFPHPRNNEPITISIKQTI